MSEKKAAETKEWALEPETEYRFELDPGTSLAIKVRSSSSFQNPKSSCSCWYVFSSHKAVPKFLDLN